MRVFNVVTREEFGDPHFAEVRANEFYFVHFGGLRWGRRSRDNTRDFVEVVADNVHLRFENFVRVYVKEEV